MKRYLLVFLIVTGICKYSFAQQPQFNLHISEKTHHYGPAYGFTQDRQGYIWFSSFSKGLIRYDGIAFKTFRYDPENANSPASNIIISLAVDSAGRIWMTHFDKGLTRFDPVTNTFTRFTNNKADPNSLIFDTVFNIMIDHAGKPGGRGVAIKVSDNGVGIPQKVLDKTFQPFFTTKPTGQGTGLGLSLSYDIVKAHGGEIKVETKDSKGTSFTILLPLNS